LRGGVDVADDDRLRELEEKYEGYKVYDNAGEKIGKVDDLFVDEHDREEYIGVKMGFFGLRSTLIPMDVARVNERDRSIEVADSRDHVKEAPHFADDDDITPEFERRIRSHFGLEGEESSSERGSYGRRSAAGAGGAAMGDNATRGETLEGNDMDDDRELDVEGSPSREPVGREEYRNREDYGTSGETGTAATGGMSDLETGDRGREEGAQTGGVPTDEAYREAYREGFREGQRERAGGGAGGEDQGASRYSGASSAGSGAQEFGDTEDDQSASTTGAESSRGGPLDRGSSERGSEQGGGDREGTRRSDEGGSEESGATRVWRRIRG
jgi:hypothetical protein